MTSTRRDFLLRLAQGTAWSAPVIRTLAAPEALRAQGSSLNSEKGGMGVGMDATTATTDPATGAAFDAGGILPTAPWSADPP